MVDRAQVEKMFDAFSAKDLNAVMAMFADDALVYDPHYPIPEMKGIAAIQRGLKWGIESLEKPGFAIRHFWADANRAAVEVDTHHVLKGGMEIKFPQVFVVEMRDGLITRFQAYEPYPPTGIAGLISSVTRLMWKLQGKV